MVNNLFEIFIQLKNQRFLEEEKLFVLGLD